MPRGPPTRQTRLALRDHLRRLRLLPDHHRVPAHPASPVRRRPRQRPRRPRRAVPEPARQPRCSSLRMTLHHPIGRALTGPTDHRHITQTLDRITGIPAVSRLPEAPFWTDTRQAAIRHYPVRPETARRRRSAGRSLRWMRWFRYLYNPRAWMDRRLRRLAGSGETECGFRVVHGAETGLTLRWRHGRARVLSGVVEFRPGIGGGVRFARPGQPWLRIEVVEANRAQEPRRAVCSTAQRTSGAPGGVRDTDGTCPPYVLQDFRPYPRRTISGQAATDT